MSNFTKTAQQWASFARIWYLIDAKMQPPGKIATMCSVRLQGKHKPIYHALSDCGDHVVVVNTSHIAFSGNKWEQKVYSSHSGYPGGFKQVTAAQLHQKDPTAIVKLAIYGMLPRNLHRRTMMQRLHLFPDEAIPNEILKNLVEELPQPRQVPRRLNEYTQEEINAFPRVWTPLGLYRNVTLLLRLEDAPSYRFYKQENPPFGSNIFEITDQKEDYVTWKCKNVRQALKRTTCTLEEVEVLNFKVVQRVWKKTSSK